MRLMFKNPLTIRKPCRAYPPTNKFQAAQRCGDALTCDIL